MYITRHLNSHIPIFFPQSHKLSSRSLSDSSAFTLSHWKSEQNKALPIYMKLIIPPEDGVQLHEAGVMPGGWIKAIQPLNPVIIFIVFKIHMESYAETAVPDWT